jgi:hypothetical protein
MLRVLTDFNAATPDDLCWLLKYQGVDLEVQADTLKIARGDKIILYPDEDDFDVSATLDFQFVDVLGRQTWVAVPDWSTLVRK